MKKPLFLFLFNIFFIGLLNAQQLSENQLKAAFIYQFGENLEWPQKDGTFDIGVVAVDTSIVRYLRLMERTKKINGEPIKIHIDNIDNLIPNCEMIYIDPEFSEYIQEYYFKVRDKPILLISDFATNQLYIMLNFISNNNKISFEINKKNIEEQNLNLKPKLLLLGGTDLDIRNLYKLKEEELQKQKELVFKQQLELNKQQAVIDSQLIAIKSQNKIIKLKKQQLDSLSNDLKNQKILLNQQQEKLAFFEQQVKQQQAILLEKMQILKSQEDSITNKNKWINKKNDQINKQINKLESLNSQIKDKEQLLKEKEENLKNLESHVKIQNRLLYSLLFIVFLIIIVAFFIYRSYKIKKILSDKLKSKNSEIEQQKEELILINKELEKLSIVASNTDNAVVIMDKNGNFEWINDGFTKMYGYNLNELLDNLGKNLASASFKNNISELIDKCLTDKKSIIYESQIKHKEGNNIWVQTTLTPILNNKKQVYKLVAIESNITKIKKAEEEIKEKNVELTRQRDEIKQKNDYINDSIIYSKRIQHATLASKEDLEKYFDFFLIYIPKDIVSGDFYWFTSLPATNTEPEKLFVAVVDCTGHGVPGALLSMIGSRLLTEIVAINKITSPAKILEELNINLGKTLKSIREIKDGMDVALCSFEKNIEDNYSVVYAGAKLPLVIYSQKEKEVKRFRGTRKSIGQYYLTKDVSFEEISFTISTKDTLYLYTDGIIDIANPNHKKFGTTRLLKLFKNIGHLDMKEQESIISKEISEWQQDSLQRDDITLLGLKLKN